MRLLISIFMLMVAGISWGQLTMEGQATQWGPTCDCYQLTNNSAQNGSVWSPYTLDLNNPFDFTFQIYLGTVDGGGADGIAFVLQANPDGLGNIGYTLGYSSPFGSPNPVSAQSLAIEVDTYHNAADIPTDIASDHVGLSNALSNDHNLGGPYPIANIEDGAWHTFRVIWDPALQIYSCILDGVPIFAVNNDIINTTFGGNPIVYFGFTASTGGAWNEQRVCAYRNVAFTPDQNPVCPDITVNLTDNTTSDLNDQIINWSWDFADGSPLDPNQNTSHAWTNPGTYPVALTITDLWNCPTTATVDITVLPDLIINADSVDITCFGDNDGQAIANVLNGTGPYIYSWDDPLNQNTQTATGLSPNTYTVDVVDDLGCTGSASTIVNEPPLLVLDSAVTTNANCGINNGSITFYANGGTPPYQYSIDGGVTFQNPTLFSNLAANNYNVEVIDNNGCSLSSVVTVNQDSPLVLDSLVATDVTCGPPDGSITAYVSAGLAPYQYSLDGGTTYQNPSFFSGLTAGNYTVQVEDANNCIVTGNVTVNSTSNLNIDNVIITDASCNGYSDGLLEIIVSGGTPAYQYSIDGGMTFQAGNIFTNLSANNFNIEVQDLNSCVDNDVAAIGEPSPVMIDNVIITDVTCNGSSDGSFEIFASGGTPGYTYSNDGGANFQAGTIFNGLLAGNYNLEVQDANGCPVSGNASVNEPALLVIDSIVVNDVTCNGLTDGSITVYTNGGTPNYQYSIDGVNFQANSNFTNMGAGPVTVDVIDNNGCPVSGNTTINESQPLVATLDNDTTICENGTATLCANISGGTAPFNYSWNGAPFAPVSCLNTPMAGIYNVVVSDANGCTSAIVEQNVYMYPPIAVLVSPDATICAGDLTQITAEAAGGDGGPYTFTWTNDVDPTVLNGNIQNVTVNANTTYTVTVTDGCESTPVTADVVINTYPVPQILIEADTNQGCQPLLVNFNNLTDPTYVASTIWDMGTGDMGSGNTPSELYEDPGCFDVNVQITTVNGCISDSTFDDFICVWQIPEAEFAYSPEDPDMFEPEVVFTNESEFADYYNWNFGDGTDTNAINPIHYYPEIGNSEYQVSLIAFTNEGCTDTAYQTVIVNEIVLYYIPNVFTPNGDQFNPKFQPVFVPGFIPLDYEFRIYNRWGELVWESYDYTAGWDGTYADKVVDDGTYTWQVVFLENQSDVKHQEFGHVTVLK